MSCHPERNLSLDLAYENIIEAKRYRDELERQYALEKRARDIDFEIAMEELNYRGDKAKELRRAERELRELELKVKMLKSL